MDLTRRSLFTLSPAFILATTVKPSGAIPVPPTGTPISSRQNQAIRRLLHQRLGDDVFSSWFSGMKFRSIEDRTINVTLPNHFLCKWIGNHYRDDVTSACQRVLGNQLAEINLAEEKPNRWSAETAT